MSHLSSQHHSFDILLAAKFGVEEAILIHHFQYWIRINRANGNNLRDGKCWTYQSRKDIADHFPYWNVDRVKYLCEKLVEEGILITGNYNKLAIDKTLWYAFVDEKAFAVDEETSKILYERQKCPSTGKSAQREGKSAQAIPDSLPNPISEESVCPKGPLSGLSVQKVIKKTSDGKEIEANQDDIFRKAIALKKPWTTEQIQEAWQALIDAKICNDAWRFMEGTIDNIRRKTGFQKMKNATEKQEKTQCPTTTTSRPIPQEIDLMKLILAN